MFATELAVTALIAFFGLMAFMTLLKPTRRTYRS